MARPHDPRHAIDRGDFVDLPGLDKPIEDLTGDPTRTGSSGGWSSGAAVVKGPAAAFELGLDQYHRGV